MTRTLHSFFASFLLLFCLPGTAADMGSVQDYDNHTVHYSVFNSTFLQPSVASSYGLNRGQDIGILNIAVHEKTDHGDVAVKAKLRGKTSNLIQQQETLTFQPIEEGSAIYYLASFRFSNEEVLHYNIEIETADGHVLLLKFTHKLYEE
ncbi:DUF4426 domain-containing protein [Aestuariirhabdus sp. Z084]|uniref:DUF4426 domain-containing protein n=1 Tax=Aestuariirhabdus haliotis TaxID=2918751 RepID=UPI00201B38E8|nr:DUF4426 domain-containing protein [Aestuariirhabdus haliotis]MCL6414151.1 DUF4426 domain-containing protein [Aestuariirhabdus haliotis]MCL6418083.1 DUF4426 domain-containing protein [Aestuariirhabdus haliotis]